MNGDGDHLPLPRGAASRLVFAGVAVFLFVASSISGAGATTSTAIVRPGPDRVALPLGATLTTIVSPRVGAESADASATTAATPASPAGPSGPIDLSVLLPPMNAGPSGISADCTVCGLGSVSVFDLPGAWLSGTVTITGPHTLRSTFYASSFRQVVLAVSPLRSSGVVGRRFIVWWDPALPTGRYAVMFTPDKGKKAQVSVRLRAGSTKGGPYVATLGSTGEFLAGSSVHLVFIGRPTHSVLTVPLIVDVWSGPAGSTEWQLSERSRSFVVWVGSDGIGEVVVDIPRDTPPGAYCFIPVDDRGTCKPIRVADSRGPLPEGIAGQLESTPSFTGAGSEFLAIVGALLLLTGCLLVLGAKRLETHET